MSGVSILLFSRWVRLHPARAQVANAIRATLLLHARTGAYQEQRHFSCICWHPRTGFAEIDHPEPWAQRVSDPNKGECIQFSAQYHRPRTWSRTETSGSGSLWWQTDRERRFGSHLRIVRIL